jgi:hypothetical protein
MLHVLHFARGYDANYEIRECTDELLPPKEEADLKARMEELEALQDEVTKSLSQPEMIEVLALNGVDANHLCISKNGIDMAVMISDGLANGLAEDCPVCGTSGLTQCAGRITCFGYMEDGTTKCAYRADVKNVKRFQFKLTDDAKSRIAPDAPEVDVDATGKAGEAEAVDYSTWKVPKLKELLKKRGLRTSGKR